MRGHGNSNVRDAAHIANQLEMPSGIFDTDAGCHVGTTTYTSVASSAQQAAMLQQQQQQQQQQFVQAQQQPQVALIADPVPYPLIDIPGRSWVSMQDKTPYWERVKYGYAASLRNVNAGVYTRSAIMEAVFSMFLCTALNTMQSMATATLGINALCVGAVYLLTLLAGYSWRHHRMLPRHGHHALTLMETVHEHFGLLQLVIYWGAQVAGSAAGGAILRGTGGGAVEQYLAAARPFLFWQAAIAASGMAGLFVFAYQFNTTTRGRVPGDSRAAERDHKFVGFLQNPGTHAAFSAFIGVVIFYGNGLYMMGNVVPWFGGGIAVGFNTPQSFSWSLNTLIPFIGALVGYFLHRLLFNINGLSVQELSMMQAVVVRSDVKEGAEETAAYSEFVEPANAGDIENTLKKFQ